MKKILSILFLSCFLFQVKGQQSISPLMPFDGDTITTFNPIFTWLLNDYATFRGSYQFVLVELEENQNSEEGITNNTSFFRLQNLTAPQLMYPFDAPVLQSNVWYAWQVQKIKDGSLVDKSEAWKFIIASNEIKEVNKYVSLQKEHVGSNYVAANQKVYFKIDEKYYSDLLKIQIFNDKMELVKEDGKNDASSGKNATLVNKKSTGSNFYELDVSGLESPGIYTLNVLDSKKQEFKLKFVVK